MDKAENSIVCGNCGGSNLSELRHTCKDCGSWVEGATPTPRITVDEALRESSEMNANLAYELKEAKSEINRHHRDFGEVSRLVRFALPSREKRTKRELIATLHEIRGIVG